MKLYWPRIKYKNDKGAIEEQWTYDSAMSVKDCEKAFEVWQGIYLIKEAWIDVTDTKDSTFKKRIEVKLTAQLSPEDAWIPVSKKMPGHYEVVLACCNDEFVTLASYNFKEKRWECLTNMNADTHFPEGEEVIAWMPMPDPIRKEEQDEESDSE